MFYLDSRPFMSILQKNEEKFDELPLFFEGDSRILKEIDGYLIGKLKPTIFSYTANGPILLEGIAELRTKLNQLLCAYLDSQGIKTSTLMTKGPLILMRKEKAAPIEVVVKSAHVGSPKHLYAHMECFLTRTGEKILPGKEHLPYVRFDWRNPLPGKDEAMPEGLADYFIDTKKAKELALKAFYALDRFLRAHEFRLIDICFFMNETGDVICAEISTDNMRFQYIGKDPELKKLFGERGKEEMICKAQKLLECLETPRIMLSGPFCTGKTTLIKRVNEELGIPKLIDDTTRPMRQGEKDEFPYHFLTREEFERKLEDNEYYEWVIFNDNYYGVCKNDLFLRKNWIMDVLSSSISYYKDRIPGLITIYLAVQSTEVLIERARQRGDSEASIQKRIEAMKNEDSSQFDFVIPEGTIEEKFQKIKALISNFSRR